MFLQKTLSNNLTLIGESREGALGTSIGFFVRTGARDETPEIAGVSHFLEHMMFKGTKKRTALELTYDFGRIGAQANAYTSGENTAYHLTILPEYLEQGMDIICDMLHSTFVQHEFDMEKKVILEEIALYQDKPHFMLYEKALSKFFGEHPAGNSVLGTDESVSGISREQLVQYFTRRYSPSNMVLAISGVFDWSHFCDLAELYCGPWKDYPAIRELPIHKSQVSSETLTKKNLQLSHICLLGDAPSAQDKNRYNADILATILGDHTGSKIYWQLVDTGLADSASIDTEHLDGTGFTMGYASTEPDNLEKVTEILKNILANASDFSDDDLHHAKTKLKTRTVLGNENSTRRLMVIGTDWIYNKEYRSLSEKLALIDNVTRDGILETLNTFNFIPTTEVKLISE